MTPKPKHFSREESSEITPHPVRTEPGSIPIIMATLPPYYQPTIQHPIEFDFNQCNYELMDDVSPEFVEKYQKLYEQDPRSRVFAPLAEAYRKMGLLKEGLELAQNGVQLHPHFSGGRVALAKIYLDLNQLPEAAQELQKAIEYSPENILAHQLLAETQLRLKKPKEALRSYKMLLFLNPTNERARKAVQKLEALTADEFEDDIFAMKPLRDAVKQWDDIEIDFSGGCQTGASPSAETEAKKSKFLERVLSLADAHLARNDVDRAIDALNEAERLVGSNPEIVRRLKLIHHRQTSLIAQPKTAKDIVPPPPRTKSKIDNQIDLLQDMLDKLKHRDIE